MNRIMLIITRDSEVIMFSPCVFVCVCPSVPLYVYVCHGLSVCLSVFVCHDVSPDDLTMKDWCHTNHICRYIVGDI